MKYWQFRNKVLSLESHWCIKSRNILLTVWFRLIGKASKLVLNLRVAASVTTLVMEGISFTTSNGSKGMRNIFTMLAPNSTRWTVATCEENPKSIFNYFAFLFTSSLDNLFVRIFIWLSLPGRITKENKNFSQFESLRFMGNYYTQYY